MKTKNKIYLLAVSVAALSLGAVASFGQVFSYTDVQNNRAVAASPRAKEQFPWLALEGVPQNSFTQRADRVPAAVKNNRSFATSPRVLEQYPELARTAWSSAVASPNSGAENSRLALVLKNRALAHSPRILEQFPQLRTASLLTDETVNVAPIK